MEKATSLPASYCGFQREGIWNVMAHSIFVLLTICCKINKALTFKSQPPPHPCICMQITYTFSGYSEKSFYSIYLIIILKSLTQTQSLASSKTSTHH